MHSETSLAWLKCALSWLSLYLSSAVTSSYEGGLDKMKHGMEKGNLVKSTFSPHSLQYLTVGRGDPQTKKNGR
jgi:hypothetical protein